MRTRVKLEPEKGDTITVSWDGFREAVIQEAVAVGAIEMSGIDTEALCHRQRLQAIRWRLLVAIEAPRGGAPVLPSRDVGLPGTSQSS